MALFCPGHILDHIGLKWCFAEFQVFQGTQTYSECWKFFR